MHLRMIEELAVLLLRRGRIRELRLKISCGGKAESFLQFPGVDAFWSPRLLNSEEGCDGLVRSNRR